jgi:DNA replication factor GINS
MGEQSEEPPTAPEPVEARGGEATASVSSTPPEEESGATEESDPPIRNDGGQAAETSLRRERVRITEDIDTFVGFDDREYDLGENDVVTLPATNVPPLLERGVAKQLD